MFCSGHIYIAALLQEDATGCKAECRELIGVAALAWRFALLTMAAVQLPE